MSIHWAWPQITYAIMAAIILLIAAVQHGEPRTGKHNFALTFCLVLLMQPMYFYGGFWTDVRP
jgi:hypothetical protein